ncbi:MAG: RloB family protein [Elusimicrobiota bacterium]|jgi:hypothetical protein|nr:RloB family protein [Elusimicrobiota bacterium]
MGNKIRPSQQFHISVEGDTEALYFEHLQKLVNECEDMEYKLKLIIKKINPISFIKNIVSTQMRSIRAFHIFDYEGNTKEYIGNFENIVKKINEANELKKDGIEYYKIGYSNLSFELWILLHKINLTSPISTKDNYLFHINKNFAPHQKVKHISDYKQKRYFERQILSKIKLSDVLMAIEFAKEIETKNYLDKKCKEIADFKFYPDNPDLTVHKCVEEILISCVVKR